MSRATCLVDAFAQLTDVLGRRFGYWGHLSSDTSAAACDWRDRVLLMFAKSVFCYRSRVLALHGRLGVPRVRLTFDYVWHEGAPYRWEVFLSLDELCAATVAVLSCICVGVRVRWDVIEQIVWDVEDGSAFEDYFSVEVPVAFNDLGLCTHATCGKNYRCPCGGANSTASPGRHVAAVVGGQPSPFSCITAQ